MRLSPVAKFSLALLPFVIAAAARAASEPSSAPEDFYNLSLAELGQVEISIATGNSTPLDRVPAAAAVITASEIQAMGARNLNEVLETVPGLHVALSSLSRLDSVYSIRGIHTGFNPQVLLMMNGIPVQYNVQGSKPTLFRLPITSIDRVEVIRGPGSAVYGADAFSGVINVITKDAASIERTQIGGATGSFGAKEVWLQGANEWNGVGIALSFAYQKTDGDKDRRVNSDLQTALDAVLGTNASLAPGSLSTNNELLDTHLAVSEENWQLNMWNWRSIDAGIGAGAAQALDHAGNDNSNLWLSDFTYTFNEGFEVWDNRVRASYLNYEQESYFVLLPKGTFLPIGSDGNLNFVTPAGLVQFPDGLIGSPSSLAEDTQLEFISVYKGWDTHRIRIAVGGRYQSQEPGERKNFGPGVIDGLTPVVDGSLKDISNTDFAFLPDSSRTIRYLSLQDEWQIYSDLQLTAGIRYDDYSDFGSATNPRVALVWVANEQLTSKLMFGSAFRAPSFTEQFSKNNPVSLGNPQLQPEVNDTTELSFNYRATNTLMTSLTLFQYRARDMIEFVQDDLATTKTAQNARDQDGKGFEWEINWKPLDRFHLASSYSQQDARDTVSNKPIHDAPRRQFKINANWEFAHNWNVNVQANHVADRARAQLDVRKPIADYTLVNFTLRRANVLPNLDFAVALRNATDEDAREPSSGEIADDYPLESRSAWLELQYRFN